LCWLARLDVLEVYLIGNAPLLHQLCYQLWSVIHPYLYWFPIPGDQVPEHPNYPAALRVFVEAGVDKIIAAGPAKTYDSTVGLGMVNSRRNPNSIGLFNDRLSYDCGYYSSCF
jgi:hypothetical protein